MESYNENDPPPPKRRSGCFWGCVGTLLAAALVIGGIFGYSAWYFYKGFEHDQRLQTVLDTVRGDARAVDVLGRNIRLLEVERHTFDLSTGRGHTVSYTLRLTGSKGDGELKADVDLGKGRAKIVLMILTGADGRRHYLVGKEPRNPMMRSI